MRRFSKRAALSTVSEINVTPLLDLAFVLLIIFIITTPFIESSSDLVIPVSGAPPDQRDNSKAAILSINARREMTFEGEPLGQTELAVRLARFAVERPGVAVVVRAHNQLPVQDLVTVMDALKMARITRVGVLTQPGEGATP